MPAVKDAQTRVGSWGLLLAAGAVLAVVAACRPPLPAPERAWRAEREAAIRSALPASARASFAGVRFFPYHPHYRVRTMLQPLPVPEPLRIAASDGSVRPARRLGRVRVVLPAGEAVLAVFQLDDLRERYPDHLFLPFRDAGAGTTTYAAGRYVEIERLAGGVLEIDFNRAYNPDCAYGIAGRCPITPEENAVPFPVEAGEMAPAGH